jgi:hypothetical protein
MEKHNKYSLHGMIEIRFADPITAIGMSERYVVIGSIMGRIAVYSLVDKQSLLISDISCENITGIIFDTDDTFTVSVGDVEYVKYKLYSDTSIQLVQDTMKFRNYESNDLHAQVCDTSFTFLSNPNLMIINLKMPSENNLCIEMTTSAVKIKNTLNNSSQDHIISMTNYTVPHDFNNWSFAWVEFLSEKERNICVYHFESKDRLCFPVLRDFGHVSFMKLLPNKKLFLVRNLNQCEIRQLDEEFKILYKFKHLGDEVIAVDFCVNSPKIMLNDMELNNIHIKNNKDEYLKVENKFYPNVDQEVIEENYNKVSDDNVCIVTLDVDGNVNVWENFSINKKFNLYDIKDISTDVKNKQFFSMGYPYQIKYNLNHFTISTDHGVFVIKSF